jgi:hypothetical protein
MVVDEDDKVSEQQASEFDWDADGDFPMPEDNLSGFMDQESQLEIEEAELDADLDEKYRD